MPAPTIQQATIPRNGGGDGLQRFVLEAAAIVGWDSDLIPRWDKWKAKGYQMTGAEWMRITGDLVGRGLIEKTPNETAVADGYDLRWLYDNLSPTPPED
jgi:hypothetical protein